MSAEWTSTRNRNPFVSTQHCLLRPLTFFPIIAALAARFGCFDGLRVQDANGRLRVAIQRVSRQFPQRIVDVDKCSIAIPLVKIRANRAHRRKISWKQAPLAASAIFIEQRVDDRPAIDLGQVPAVGQRDGDEQRG